VFLDDAGEVGVALEVELGGGLRAAVAGEAVGGEERPDGIGEPLVESGFDG
jgi:hypothetical protein